MEGRAPSQDETQWGVATQPLQDIAPHVVAETATQRLTAQDAEKAKAEKEASYTALMDDMEASTATQGQYFIRLGDKVPITEQQQETRSRFLGMGVKTTEREMQVGQDDRRVLVLNSTILGQYNDSSGGRTTPRGTREYTMVTRDGIKTLELREDKDGKYENTDEIINKLRDGRRPTVDNGFFLADNGRLAIRLGYISDTDKGDMENDKVEGLVGVGPYEKVKPFNGSLEDFGKRVQASIDKTESPHKQIVENETKAKQMATGAADMIRGLPPRP